MANPRICPLSLKPEHPSALNPRDVNVNFCSCIGPQCMLWQYAGNDPKTGDCAFNITAQGASVIAHTLAQKSCSGSCSCSDSDKAD